MEIVQYRPIKKNSLEAMISLSVPKWGDFIIRDICYFVKGNRQWVSFPSRMYEVNGEKKYWSYMAFKDPANDRLFKEKVLTAIQTHISTFGNEKFPSNQSEDDGRI